MDPIESLAESLRKEMPTLACHCRRAKAKNLQPGSRIVVTLRTGPSGVHLHRFTVEASAIDRWGADAVARQISIGIAMRNPLRLAPPPSHPSLPGLADPEKPGYGVAPFREQPGRLESA